MERRENQYVIIDLLDFNVYDLWKNLEILISLYIENANRYQDMENQGEIILYQPDKEVKLEVRLENETVWLSIDEMSQLFGRDISVIGKHIRNIFKEGELVKDSVWAKFAYTASDGKIYQVDY